MIGRKNNNNIRKRKKNRFTIKNLKCRREMNKRILINKRIKVIISSYHLLLKLFLRVQENNLMRINSRIKINSKFNKNLKDSYHMSPDRNRISWSNKILTIIVIINRKLSHSSKRHWRRDRIIKRIITYNYFNNRKTFRIL